MFGAAISCELFFQRRDFAAAYVLPAFEHPRHGPVNFGLLFVILGGKIKEADHAKGFM